jgi:hypothetical protein
LVELIEKVLKIISNLPDPANLVDVIEKIQESDNTMEIDVAKKLLIADYLNKQPENKGVFIDNVILRSVSPCDECGADINNGYFKILLASGSNSAKPSSIQVEQKIVVSFEALHNMMNHKIPDNYMVAANENLGEIEQENLKKNPRDQLNQQELEKTIETFTLKEIDTKLREMMTKLHR